MSIQSVIDKALSDDGRNMRDITVTGESGSASVPEFCRVNFVNCSISSLTIRNDCNIVVVQSTITGTVTQTSGTLTLDRCTISGDIEVTEGTRILQKKCTTTKHIKLTQGSILDAYENVRSGSGADYAVKAEKNSKATISTDKISGYNKSVVCEEHSGATLREVTTSAVDYVLHGKDHGQFEVFGGKMTCDNKVIRLEESSSALVTNFKELIKGEVVGVSLKTNSTATITNVVGIKGENIAIELEDNCKVSLHNFGTIEGVSTGAVTLKQSSEYTSIKGDSIKSTGGPAFTFTSSCTATVKDVTEVTSQGNDALVSSSGNGTKFEMYKGVLKGLGGHAVRAGDNDEFVFNRVTSIEGKEKAFQLGNQCKLNITKTSAVFGTSSDAIVAGDDLTISMKDVGSLEGKGGACIIAGSGLDAVFDAVSSLLGTKGNCITCGSKSKIRGLDVTDILGVKGYGITAGEKSDIEFRRFSQLKGLRGLGIEAPKSRVYLLNGGSLEGLEGAGIIAEGSGSDVYIYGLYELRGHQGAGIRVSDGRLYIEQIETLSAGGRGVVLANSRAEIRNSTTVKGAAGSIKSDKSVVVVDNVTEMSGSVVYQLDNTVGSFRSIKTIEGSSILNATNGCKLSYALCKFTGNVTLQLGSDLDMDQIDMEGNIEATSAVLKAKRVTVDGTVEFTECAVELIGTGVGDATLTDSSGVFISSTTGALQVSAGGIIASGCTFASVVLASAGLVQSYGSGDVTGSGSVVLVEAGTMTMPVYGMAIPPDGIVLVYGNQILSET